MSAPVDLAVIGAGPAGLAAAVRARSFGLAVTLLDEQPAPGGQVWRAVETRMAAHDGFRYPGDEGGLALAKEFRASGATYLPAHQVWAIEPGFTLFASSGGRSETLAARALLLATGAQERPVPFPGWTLPGVMTIGAAQILLKTSGQIPDAPVLIAGTGPLLLLYACQLLDSGGKIAAILDTAPKANRGAGLRHLPKALAAHRDLARGLGWQRQIKAAGVKTIRHVRSLVAQGTAALEAVSYTTEAGEQASLPASLLLVHEGVIPSIHVPLSLGCACKWRDDQLCFAPVLDEWAESSMPGVFIAGDGAGIGGAAAAAQKGEVAAIGIAHKLGRIDPAKAAAAAKEPRERLARALVTRPMLDALYRPRQEVLTPADDVLVCRCEEVTAGRIRAAAGVGIAGPNQVKAFTRAGMGPCQGRQCGHAVAAIIAAASGQSMDECGFYRIRPPLKPVTLAEIAALDLPEVEMLG